MDATVTKKRVIKAPEDRRRELMDAAVRVFVEKGFAGASVAQICAAADVAKGTFYVYFDSKEHLLGALKERHADEFIHIASEHAQRVGTQDMWALGEAMLEAMVDHELAHRDLVQVLCQEGFTDFASPVFAEAERKVRDIVAGGIWAGVEAGAFRCDDPETTASLLVHGIKGTVMHAILYEVDIDRDRLLAAARDLVRRALDPGAARRIRR